MNSLAIAGSNAALQPLEACRPPLTREELWRAGSIVWATVTGLLARVASRLRAKDRRKRRADMREIPDYLLRDIGIKRCETEFGVKGR